MKKKTKFKTKNNIIPINSKFMRRGTLTPSSQLLLVNIIVIKPLG